MIYDHFTPWRHWWLHEMRGDRPADFWVVVGVLIFVVIATAVDMDWGRVILDLFQ